MPPLLLLLVVVGLAGSIGAELDLNSSHHSWLLMLESADDDTAGLKRIMPKSVFIAPPLTSRMNRCGEGYRYDAAGRCVKVIRVDAGAHLDQILKRLQNSSQRREQAALAARPHLEKPSNGPTHFSFSLPLGPEKPVTLNSTKTSTEMPPPLTSMNDTIHLFSNDSSRPTEVAEVNSTSEAKVETATSSTEPVVYIEGSGEDDSTTTTEASFPLNEDSTKIVDLADDTYLPDPFPTISSNSLRAIRSTTTEQTPDSTTEEIGVPTEIFPYRTDVYSGSGDNPTEQEPPILSELPSYELVSESFVQPNISVPVENTTSRDNLEDQNDESSEEQTATAQEESSTTDVKDLIQNSSSDVILARNSTSNGLNPVRDSESNSGLIRFPDETNLDNPIRFPEDTTPSWWWLQPDWKRKENLPTILKFWSMIPAIGDPRFKDLPDAEASTPVEVTNPDESAIGDQLPEAKPLEHVVPSWQTEPSDLSNYETLERPIVAMGLPKKESEVFGQETQPSFKASKGETGLQPSMSLKKPTNDEVSLRTKAADDDSQHLDDSPEPQHPADSPALQRSSEEEVLRHGNQKPEKNPWFGFDNLGFSESVLPSPESVRHFLHRGSTPAGNIPLPAEHFRSENVRLDLRPGDRSPFTEELLFLPSTGRVESWGDAPSKGGWQQSSEFGGPSRFSSTRHGRFTG